MKVGDITTPKVGKYVRGRSRKGEPFVGRVSHSGNGVWVLEGSTRVYSYVEGDRLTWIASVPPKALATAVLPSPSSPSKRSWLRRLLNPFRKEA